MISLFQRGTRRVQLSVAPGYFLHRYGDGPETDGRAWRVLVSTAWQARANLGMRVTYQHVRQNLGPLGTAAAPARPWIARNLVAVSFSVGVGRPRTSSANPGFGPLNTGSTR